jgi:hypothetical protein
MSSVHLTRHSAGGLCPLKSPDKRFPSPAVCEVNINQMTQPKLTDEITVKLADGFRARLDRVAACDKRKPGQWARKVLEEAVDQWEQANRDEGKISSYGAALNSIPNRPAVSKGRAMMSA